MPQFQAIITAILATLFAARLTRFVVLDSLLDRPRERLEQWANARKHAFPDGDGDGYDVQAADEDPHWLVVLISCPWCIGFWIAGAVAASAVAWGHTGAWQFVAGVWALSFVSSALVAKTS